MGAEKAIEYIRLEAHGEDAADSKATLSPQKNSEETHFEQVEPPQVVGDSNDQENLLLATAKTLSTREHALEARVMELEQELAENFKIVTNVRERHNLQVEVLERELAEVHAGKERIIANQAAEGNAARVEELEQQLAD